MGFGLAGGWAARGAGATMVGFAVGTFTATRGAAEAADFLAAGAGFFGATGLRASLAVFAALGRAEDLARAGFFAGAGLVGRPRALGADARFAPRGLTRDFSGFALALLFALAGFFLAAIDRTPIPNFRVSPCPMGPAEGRVTKIGVHLYYKAPREATAGRTRNRP